MKTYQETSKKFSLKAENSNFQKVKICSSLDCYDFVKQFYHDDINIYESVFCVFLNQANNTIGWSKISQGGITATVIDSIIIAKYAIESLAKSVILVHNHPTGNLTASAADKSITTKVNKVLNLFDCKVLDHLIISENGYLSFADEGIL